MDLEKMSLTELKALAFDLQQEIGIIQNNLQIVAQKIQEKNSISKNQEK